MKISQIPEIIEKRDIHSLPPTAMVSDAVDLMSKKNIGAIPIVDGKKLVGIFSERDVMKRVVRFGKKMDETPLSSVMTTAVSHVGPNDDIQAAIDLMVVGKYRHMPILDEEGILVGFLSQRDFVALSWMELIKYKATH